MYLLNKVLAIWCTDHTLPIPSQGKTISTASINSLRTNAVKPVISRWVTTGQMLLKMMVSNELGWKIPWHMDCYGSICYPLWLRLSNCRSVTSFASNFGLIQWTSIYCNRIVLELKLRAAKLDIHAIGSWGGAQERATVREPCLPEIFWFRIGHCSKFGCEVVLQF